ncbi:MAG: 50S ribosomal protein L29 [Candidatus Zixiibacteriota bacterium]
MKTFQLRDMTEEQLIAHMFEVEEEIFNLRMQKAIKQIPDVKKLSNLKHELARCKTILQEHNDGIRKLKGA